MVFGKWRSGVSGVKPAPAAVPKSEPSKSGGGGGGEERASQGL